MKRVSPKQVAHRVLVVAAQNEAMARDGHRCQVRAGWRARIRFNDPTVLDSDPEGSTRGEAIEAARGVECRREVVPHHRATQRSRRDLADKPGNIVTLCDPHHRWVHANPNYARLLELYGVPAEFLPEQDGSSC